jgi:hypothetical protein
LLVAQPVLLRFYQAMEPPASVSPGLLEDVVHNQAWKKVSVYPALNRPALYSARQKNRIFLKICDGLYLFLG